MATVHLPAGLVRYTGGVEVLDIDAPRVKELLETLVARHPELAGRLDTMAVAIDGEIHNDPDYLPVQRHSEVYLVPRIAGGSSVWAGHSFEHPARPTCPTRPTRSI